jgi:hypothetical protein
VTRGGRVEECRRGRAGRLGVEVQHRRACEMRVPTERRREAITSYAILCSLSPNFSLSLYI